jgi:hypothetical protein
MSKRLCLCALALLLRAGWGFSQDYGLSLRSLPSVQGEGILENFIYTGNAAPWFASPLGEQGDLYLSGGFSADYAAGEWKPIPELYRFEFLYRFDSGLNLGLGRLARRDPLNLLMNGLYDGLSIDFDWGMSRVSTWVFYTGLLYKKAAHITISPGDYTAYSDRDRYFASRRLVLSMNGEIPNLFDGGGKLNLGIVEQIDLNGADPGNGRIHSLYVLAKLTRPFLDRFNAELGLIPGMIAEEGRAPGFCFALNGSLVWLPPGQLNNRLSLNMALSSGGWGNAVKAFLPINTLALGRVLRPKISGLALVETGYTARLHDALSADLWAAYLFRTDSYTYTDPGLDMNSLSPLLGGEVYGGLTWAPFSDLSLTLGGGAFFPQWGRSFRDGLAPRWRVSLETIISL